MPEVVITGVGMVTALGATAAETAQAWREGRSAAGATVAELRGTVLEDTEVVPLPPLDAPARLRGWRMVKYASRQALLGLLAARDAVRESEAIERHGSERVGLFAGTGLAAAEVTEVLPMIERSIDARGEFSCRLLGERGLAAANPLLSFRILANMPGCLISIAEGIRGPNLLFTPWEGQTGAALVEAWRAVEAGEVPCALTGAADAPAQPAAVVVLRQNGHLRPHERPSSGAAYLVMESAASAAAAGRKVHARVRRLTVTSGAGREAADPLAERLGRTVAAAPAILLGLAALTGTASASLVGSDGVRVSFELGAA